MANRLVKLRSAVAIRWLSTAPAAAATEAKPKHLYAKLFEQKIKPDSVTELREAIDEWANQQKLNKPEILTQIKFCRRRKHYHFALQLSEWMENCKIDMTDADRAVHIDLVAKTRGTESAEIYFNSIQESAKTTRTYGALLSCYCKDKWLDKALHPLLAQETEQKRFKTSIFSNNTLINSYAAQKDLDAAVKLLEDMQQKDVKCDWVIYRTLATIHINTGMHHKAAGFIHRMELENERNREYFHSLITLYTKISDLSGVNRSWVALKSVFPVPNNAGYLMMMLALSKLGDLESLEKCFKEWESSRSMYDFRVTNVVLESYLQRDMIGEAHALYESMVAKGNKPNLRTMELLTHHHIKKHQIDSALKYLEMGSAKVKCEEDKWFPNDGTIEKFLDYFERRNDAYGAKKFCSIMKKIDRLDSTVCESLLSSQGVDSVDSMEGF